MILHYQSDDETCDSDHVEWKDKEDIGIMISRCMAIVCYSHIAYILNL